MLSMGMEGLMLRPWLSYFSKKKCIEPHRFCNILSLPGRSVGRTTNMSTYSSDHQPLTTINNHWPSINHQLNSSDLPRRFHLGKIYLCSMATPPGLCQGTRKANSDGINFHILELLSLEMCNDIKHHHALLDFKDFNRLEDNKHSNSFHHYMRFCDFHELKIIVTANCQVRLFPSQSRNQKGHIHTAISAFELPPDLQLWGAGHAQEWRKLETAPF